LRCARTCECKSVGTARTFARGRGAPASRSDGHSRACRQTDLEFGTFDVKHILEKMHRAGALLDLWTALRAAHRVHSAERAGLWRASATLAGRRAPRTSVPEAESDPAWSSCPSVPVWNGDRFAVSSSSLELRSASRLGSGLELRSVRSLQFLSGTVIGSQSPVPVWNPAREENSTWRAATLRGRRRAQDHASSAAAVGMWAAAEGSCPSRVGRRAAAVHTTSRRHLHSRLARWRLTPPVNRRHMGTGGGEDLQRGGWFQTSSRHASGAKRCNVGRGGRRPPTGIFSTGSRRTGRVPA
jgi:hypothetical protein